jgi:4-hydroxy-tetrahydrodipicolinate reductase
MIKIAIVGYGKMGKEIEQQAKELGVPISRVIDRKDDLQKATFQSNEVAIEFTSPEACLENFHILVEKKIPVICGTTGWMNHVHEIESLVKKNQGSFLYASNFSIGVHLFWRTLEQLSKSMNTFPQYNVSLREIHHTQKKDKPSGTGKTSAEIITKNINRITNLNIESIREGNVVGDHYALFDSAEDAIELSHKAKNRAGFAKGAITCATWLHGKQGFFSIEDYLRDTLK